jgi:SAM-dependent methyltransferase
MVDREAQRAALQAERRAARQAERRATVQTERAAQRAERRAARELAKQIEQPYAPSPLIETPLPTELPELMVWLQQREAPRAFSYRGQTYRYFRHDYNSTWLHERAVEVPIIFGLVRKHRAGRVLEIGNVLSHYFPVEHDVVDKYEPGERVINQDILDFAPSAKYDLIVSVSTLEHVGWDEKPSDPDKVTQVVDRVRTFLRPGGRFVFTVPIGYNPEMDQSLRDGRFACDELICLKRVSEDNHWEEVPCQDAWDARYNKPFYCANALAIGVIAQRRSVAVTPESAR